MEKTLITKRPAAEGTRRNFFVSVAKKLNEKRKKIGLAITTFIVMNMATAVSAFAEAGGGAAGGGAINDNIDADAAFVNLVGFFAKWIGRIGLVVAFVGAVLFGLAVKQEDAEGKQRGLMTLASGFIVFAITKSLNLFGFNTGII